MIAQIGIISLGVTAVFLVSRKNKWGFVIGLISQPFYFITSILNQQIGIFITTFLYW